MNDRRPLQDDAVPSPADLDVRSHSDDGDHRTPALDDALSRLRSEVEGFVDSDGRGTDAASVLEAGHALHDTLQDCLGRADV